MGPWIGNTPSGSTDEADRLVAVLARRRGRRGSAKASTAGRISDELVAMGDAAVPALVKRLDVLGDAGCAALARIGPRAFPALVEQLRVGSARRRCLAARALELTAFAAAVSPLRYALLDRDPAVRAAAQHALEGLAKTWVRRLREGDRRDEAVRVLTAVGEPAVWPLAHVLHDRYVGLFAARILGQIGEPAVRATLLVLAQARRSPGHEDWAPAFANATLALADIGAPALDQVLCLLRDEQELANVRRGAVHVLGRMGSIATPHLVAAMQDADPSVREAAAAALARLTA